jgi:NO-binding membrane sensor protein with MHYT domain
MPRSTGIGIVPETTHRLSGLISSAKLVGCGILTQHLTGMDASDDYCTELWRGHLPW